MRERAITTILLLAALGCEKPRERACRSLTIQAKNAEDMRTSRVEGARMAAYRAQSAARWVRSNAVEDAALKTHANALADALERLADARLRIQAASEVLGAADAPDLLARAERVSAYVAASDRVLQVGRKPCPWHDPESLIDDPRCAAYHARESCPAFDAQLTFAQHTEACLQIADKLPDVARAPAEATELASAIRGHAEWAKSLPTRSAKETVDRARGIPSVLEDHGRADADVTMAVSALEAKCAQ